MGYTKKEVVGKRIWGFMYPDSISFCQKKFAKLMKGKKIRGLEVTFVAKDGHVIYLEGHASPIFKGEKVVETEGFFKDITKRKELELELSTANKALRYKTKEMAKNIKQFVVANQKLITTERALGERMKELECFYAINQLSEKPGITMDRLFSETVRIVPKAWQYSNITCANITFDGKKYGNLKRCKIAAKRLSVYLVVNNKKRGRIGVGYAQAKSFLKEEVALLNSIAKILENAIARRDARDTLKHSEKKYKLLAETLDEVVYRSDPTTFETTYVNPAIKRVWGHTAKK
ncbi:PAS domain S-box protein, partial [Candidatus Woesearchaeota archaeon]|nr:PAS domain S-box protein [Candidatus Woesearchaeota archaeon]